MTTKSEFSPATYEAVATDSPADHYELTATVLDPSFYCDKPVKSADCLLYSSLPEVQNLTWTDTFFDDDDDVIAVFDFDYEAMENFYTSVGWVALGCTVLYGPLLAVSLLGLAPCFLRSNARWNARAQHVAITRDGIRFVREKRKSCWGMPCTDQGRSSKTVPFDKITDCDVEEPAGNTCLCVPNVLTTVNVDTASSGPEGRKELKIAGLKDPHSFKKVVWAMKRAQGGIAVGLASSARAPNALEMAERQLQQNGANEGVATLLRDIRDELRQHNELLLKLQTKSSSSEVAQESVPSDAELL